LLLAFATLAEQILAFTSAIFFTACMLQIEWLAFQQVGAISKPFRTLARTQRGLRTSLLLKRPSLATCQGCGAGLPGTPQIDSADSPLPALIVGHLHCASHRLRLHSIPLF
jgi:hypothetical protein